MVGKLCRSSVVLGSVSGLMSAPLHMCLSTPFFRFLGVFLHFLRKDVLRLEFGPERFDMDVVLPRQFAPLWIILE